MVSFEAEFCLTTFILEALLFLTAFPVAWKKSFGETFVFYRVLIFA